MNTTLIVGFIEGPINVKVVGDQQLKLAEYKIDGLPVQSWGDSADKVPPIGTQVAATGFVKARTRQAQSGATFTDISISISRFELIGVPRVAAGNPGPAAASVPADFED